MADTFSVQLPPSVEQLIAEICTKQQQPRLGNQARRELASIGEDEALEILRTISSTEIKKTFDGFVFYLVKKWATNNGSPGKRLCLSPQSPQQSSRSPTTTRLMMPARCESVFQSPVHLESRFSSASSSAAVISPQLEALGELEFRKAFLILSYMGGYKLENVISAEKIRGIKDLPMDKFEIEVWNSIGFKCGYVKDNERPRYFVWDCGITHIYHCHVYADGTYRFKGPHLTTLSNFLQRALGDDNVLMVKFAEEETEERSSASSSVHYYANYKKLAIEGVLVGLRRYRFFVFKDGGKEAKKKDPTTSPVKCFFVRTESNASSDSPDYILHGKTIGEARSMFMNVNKLLPSLSKYMARLSLVLSKTLKLDVDLSGVNIEKIDDIQCRDNNGNVLEDKDGKPRIHTDGTGFISEDLASKCPKNVFKGKSNNASNIEGLLDCIESRKLPETKIPEPRNGELPLLIQFRMFNNGGAYKGTFLVNKKLPSGTIQVRPSMTKVDPDAEPKACSQNSLEIVSTSNRPKRAYLSRYLIPLLRAGGVPEEFFMDLLKNALEDTQGALTKKHAALRVTIVNGEMDDYTLAKMLLSGIPLEEPFVQHHLRILMKEEKKNLRGGRIPIPESYYLMGTADPTGRLESDEVCVILDNGQISGKVLVYRNPGLHFGDVHILNATYVKDLEDFVGNAKYGIFFPCRGPRSLADEMAGGDFDGDTYFVSRNPELLEKFKQSQPFIPLSSTDDMPNKQPCKFSEMELEDELFKLFLTARFQPNHAAGVAADSWSALMDRYLTLEDDRSDERDHMKRNMVELIDKYYDALDAPKKGGKKIFIPEELKAELFPHHMEREKEISYTSTSILGLIYDKVKSFEEADPPEIVWKLPSFNDRVSEPCLEKWKTLHNQYRQEMTIALKNKETKDKTAKEVYKKYKEILYEAAEFEESKRKEDDIFEEALAIYEVCYNHAITKQAEKRPGAAAEKKPPAGYCGFAWKVAGQALCKLYSRKQANCEKTMMIYTTPSALKELL
ncbi:probable RNA-dependent RNA polymerase 5 isoform X3 [Jatropha curcas]|uniref:probable RNA-dependent RNA polymerase 5 isoform X3 n=1 Tax=Jatropha curcas TaxID=180498 RepID=UPI0009D64811|nr:probable RNA-dependent RNA polymerase 5 isoform X3 [Jatropha curcas]